MFDVVYSTSISVQALIRDGWMEYTGGKNQKRSGGGKEICKSVEVRHTARFCTGQRLQSEMEHFILAGGQWRLKGWGYGVKP